MGDQIQANNKRIAKNTLLLYFRMILTMAVSLYTSRIVLATLGIEDYGIYNVVGGVVAMFSMISSALSAAISRFVNFEMGRGSDEYRLKVVFSTSLNVQIILSVIITLLAETIGLWFLCNKLVIPAERIHAANGVFHCSVAAFVVNLISVPYNASIIAHERMKAFAYVSIIESFLKLGSVYLLLVGQIDRLIFYAILQLVIACIIRYIYGRYCSQNFEECHYLRVMDLSLLKEMMSYSIWNLLGTAAQLLRTQGVNIVINLFCGPVVNAARGISSQVNNAVSQFVSNFTTALNPQIVQNYASGNYSYCLNLVYQGARLSYYLLLLISLPVIIETDYILSLWLKEVPDHTVLFVRLILVLTMITALSNTLIRLILSDGNIKNYAIAVACIQLLNLPLDYVFMRFFSMPPEGTILIAIILETCTLFVRLYMIGKIIPISTNGYISHVICNVLVVTIISFVVPYILYYYANSGTLRFLMISITSIISCFCTMLFIGCNKSERQLVYANIKRIQCRIKRR